MSKKNKVEITEAEFILVAPGAYRAAIEDVELQPSGPDGVYGLAIKWYFKILDELYEDVVVTALSSTEVSPKTKLYSWLTTLGFDNLQPGQVIAFSDIRSWLFNKECIAVVKHKIDYKDPSKVHANVTDIFSSRNKLDQLSEYQAKKMSTWMKFRNSIRKFIDG